MPDPVDAEALAEVVRKHGYRPSAARGVERCYCGEGSVGQPGWHAAHVAAELLALVRDAQAAALRDAADDVRRVREEGLLPDEDYGPESPAFEDWLRERADRIKGRDNPERMDP